MPKYIPTEDDLWVENPCPICGKDVISDYRDVCSMECQLELDYWEEDMEYMMIEELYEDDWEEGREYWEAF
jgi:endogenous inhibitor of DNA gyrase (YacG/DUF329 family)